MQGGFIGPGATGTPMAWNVGDAGYALGVHDRTATKTESVADGGVVTDDSPRAIATTSDVVVTTVRSRAALLDPLEAVTGRAVGKD